MIETSTPQKTMPQKSHELHELHESQEPQEIFQFTLGPVQGFVAQARRTRDFWAGSFILSWLSSVAIACIQKQGGHIQFPVPDPAYMRVLLDSAQPSEHLPQQGSIPNRFLATTARVPAGFHPEWVSHSVQAAWQALAEVVWNNDLQGKAAPITRQIWQRQVGNFWEISWVLSSENEALESKPLDRRKNWRSPLLPDEPGHKCMVMDGWQELSGETDTALKPVQSFWTHLRTATKGMELDLSENEQLCALAFIKRRFARHFEQVKIAPENMPGGWGQIQGWRVPSAVPSVAFLAAAPWLARVIQRVSPEDFRHFDEAARQLTSYSEAAHVQTPSSDTFEIDIRCVREAAQQRCTDGFRRLWAGLDGQVYFRSALENPRIFNHPSAAKEVLRQLNRLVDKAGVKEPPSPYYAILLMDGDQLGKHMGNKANQGPISQALNEFTAHAGDLVRQHNGFLIYAGGDDVLALLPLEDALPAAAALQASYKAAFEKYSPKDDEGKYVIESTLSGAIEFAHFRTPLTRVLKDSHQLLDDIAKDKIGRNAIAVRVQKPSGMAVEWAMPWDKALDEEGKVLISEVAQKLVQEPKENVIPFSNKFFFRMQKVLERFGTETTIDHTLSQNISPERAEKVRHQLLLAEYLHSYDQPSRREKPGSEEMKKLEDHLKCLLAQCYRWQRVPVGKEIVTLLHPTHPIDPNGALLVRFLVQKGLED